MINACTIIAANYWPQAQVLRQSLLDTNPDATFTVLLVDDEARELDFGPDAGSVLRLPDIGLRREDIRHLAAIYDVTELSTAVKPLLLKRLLSQSSDVAVYLDPDIRVYGSLAELTPLGTTHGIVLTPHTMTALPRDDRRLSPTDLLAAGVFNLGFIAVGPSAGPFLDWWWEQTQRDALSDLSQMLFTDQRWIDFVPCLFDHYILKDPGYNVAYWNLHARQLAWNDGNYTVNGSPLRFFHFSGYDPRQPWMLSKHQTEMPRVLLSEHPAVARICDEYAEALKHARDSRLADRPYGWARTRSGVPLTVRMRRLFRQALLNAEIAGQTAPPGPFDDDDGPFMAFLNEPVAPSIAPRISRYLYAIYQERPDLRAHFRDLTTGARRYLQWVLSDGIRQEYIPLALRPDAARLDQMEKSVFPPPSDPRVGANVVGYFRAELGVGEAGRLVVSALDAVNVPRATIAFDRTQSRQTHPFNDDGPAAARFGINITCVNADETPQAAAEFGQSFSRGRYRIGYWFWEVERFPETMFSGFGFVDEVWTATPFVQAAVAQANRVPVTLMPLPIVPPQLDPSLTRASFGLPADRFVFLFVFDCLSVIERKNPMGVIEAFTRAFKPGEGPLLVIKTINGHRRRADLERIRLCARNRPDILLTDGYVAPAAKNSLINACDCYVSLHRSEGLGLTMAEAMALGKPVIATAYSGNLSFMTPDNSFLVDYAMSAVPEGCGPYPAGTPWADPSLDLAAELMRRTFEDREHGARLGERARRDVLERFSPAICGARMAAHLGTRPCTALVDAAVARRGSRATTPSSPADPNPLDSSLATAVMVEPRTEASGRFSAIRRTAQRLLFRGLRPYWHQHRTTHEALAAAARTLDGRVRALEDAVAHTRSELNGRLDRHGHALQHLGVRHSAIIDVATRQGQDGQFESRLDRLESSVGDALDGVARQGPRLQELFDRLYAAPYVSNPDLLHFTDSNGERALGFLEPADASAGYRSFEDVFRGDESFIRNRLKYYVPLLAASQPVCEIGCGRGELLSLLRDEGIAAEGVDHDESMIQRCRESHLPVVQADGLEYLASRPKGSIGAVIAAHVIEHLDFDTLMQLLELARERLRSGGYLILETPNPHCLEAFKTFSTDLTHRAPIFPEVLVALCRTAGYREARITFPYGSGPYETDLRTRGEYAIFARA